MVFVRYFTALVRGSQHEFESSLNKFEPSCHLVNVLTYLFNTTYQLIKVQTLEHNFLQHFKIDAFSAVLDERRSLLGASA